MGRISCFGHFWIMGLCVLFCCSYPERLPRSKTRGRSLFALRLVVQKLVSLSWQCLWKGFVAGALKSSSAPPCPCSGPCWRTRHCQCPSCAHQACLCPLQGDGHQAEEVCCQPAPTCTGKTLQHLGLVKAGCSPEYGPSAERDTSRCDFLAVPKMTKYERRVCICPCSLHCPSSSWQGGPEAAPD